jgi:hypothetical protein
LATPVRRTRDSAGGSTAWAWGQGVTIIGAGKLLAQDGTVALTLPHRSVIADSRELAAALVA